MMILINCSNLKNGGGLQVADSICCQLSWFTQHRFIVVLSSQLNRTKDKIGAYPNVEAYTYDIRNNFQTIVCGRDAFLDRLVETKQVDAVLTVFGPSRWVPRCKHLCGFARAQLLLNVKGYRLKIRDRLEYAVWDWAFRRCSKVFYTENAYISGMLEKRYKGVRVYTVTNYYNQVFDQPERWGNSLHLPEFNGTTILTITSNGAWKNMKITAGIARYLRERYPFFRFRFVTTLTADEASFITDDIRDYFCLLGRVDVSECPHLYEQANVMLMPSFMECFTATYPEAMRMEVPIVTTDLEFAHGLCGDAACYYDALDGEAAAEAIYKVATDKEYARALTEAGKKQLKTFDNYEQRVEKLIHILETIAKE